MDSDCKAAIDSISSCIAVLHGDLQQPGTPAIVLKLAASWKKLQPYLPAEDSPCQQSAEQRENVQIDNSEEPVLQTDYPTSVNSMHGAPIQEVTARDSNVSTMATHLNSDTTEQSQASESHNTESSVITGASQPQATNGDDGNTLGEDYQRVDFPVLYYHKGTGYYFDPSTRQFLAPSSYYQAEGNAEDSEGASSSVAQYVAQQPNQQVEVQQAASTSSQAGQTSIADMLAAASDRVVERLGYEYSEALDMYYCGNSGLYYDQDTKLYYDPDLGCYYEYDFDTKKYSLHSRVSLPEKPKERARKRSSSPEFFDPLEEGEIRQPHIPHGSPPPEEDWAPCLRAIVSESEKLKKGTLFIITQDGAYLGREPTTSGRGLSITIAELKVSKLHAAITYDKHEKSFMVQDLGSVNGTFLNKDQRLSEPRKSSMPCPLVHGHTLTLGSTTLVLHIHSGWENCAWCDPSRGAFLGQQSEDAGAELPEEELDVQRRKELNRIKKKYGLRVKDTYNEEVKLQKGYSDRSEHRRKTVGSDVPPSDRPTVSSSVHSAIAEDNKGRAMLQKLGWKEGQGLGIEQQGITEPVANNVRPPKAGLGAVGVTSRSLDSGGETNSAAVKSQLMQKRFQDALQLEKAKRRKLDSPK